MIAEPIMHSLVDARPNGIDMIERALADMPPAALQTIHHFSEGIYARELRIPAGTVLTGKIHKTRHLNIISAGRIRVWSETEGVKHIEAPHTFVAEAGTRRLGYAETDTVWTCVHATTETDLNKLEIELIEPHENPLLHDWHGRALA